MRTTIENITPQRATELLANNPRNRPLVESRVALLARAIQAGQWRLTHQGIAISDRGALEDGQHRLTAIARSGMTVPLQVSVMDEDVFDVIDTGRGRGPRDILAMAGLAHAQRLPPAIRLVGHYRGPLSGVLMAGQNAPKLTNTDFLRITSEQTDFVALAGLAERAAVSVGRRGLVTGLLAAMVVVQQDAPELPTESAEFWERFIESVMLEEDSPILSLRRWLTITVPTETRGRGQLTM